MHAKLRSFLRNYFRFEHDYFTVGGWRKDLMYFLAQGNIWAHIVDRVKFRLFPKFMIVADFPSHVDIEAASNCQMRCPMCYTTHMPDELKGVMKWDVFTKIVDEAAARKVYSIKLSWRGEPLLNKNIVEMVRYAKKKGIKEVAFLSNGELLTREMAEQLVDAGLDWLSISADGVGEVYNEIRAPAIFEETIAKVRYMGEYRDGKGLNKPLLRVQSIMSAVEKDPGTFYSSWKDLADRINVISDNVRDFEIKELKHDPYYVCPKPWERMTIAHDGRIHQCNTDYLGVKILGDCRTQSLRDIWHGAGYTEVREAFCKHRYLTDLPACRNCSYGLVEEKATINVGGEMQVSRYKSVEKIVDDSGVRLKTPEERLTSRIKEHHRLFGFHSNSGVARTLVQKGPEKPRDGG